MRAIASCLWSLILPVGIAVIEITLPSSVEADEQIRLGLPVNCELGVECFVQQMPDLDAGSGTLDPLCGQSTYQGHDGWDIRLRSLDDIAKDVPVVAAADGIVLRVRDGLPDRIVESAHDRDQLRDKECGNGAVIEHRNGISTQYCHLKAGSIRVRTGAYVGKGDRLGSIGSSGLAEFPHVHMSVRWNGQLVEPLTGKTLGSHSRSCGDLSGSLLDAASKDVLARPTVAILGVGLAEAAPDLSSLVKSSGPPTVTSRGNSTIAWVWAINVEEGSQFRMRVIGPGEEVFTDHTTAALPRRKANYLAYAGRKKASKVGSYRVSVEIIIGERLIASTVRSVIVAD